MKPETLAALTRQAEETYQVQYPPNEASDTEIEFLYDMNAGRRSQQQAFISGATPWIEKLEAIRAEVETGASKFSEGTASGQVYREILSIIDKHVKQ